MGNTKYKATYERVARYFTRERYAHELSEAKDTYYSRAGKVFEDDPNFEHQMATFLEWYLLDRELSRLSIPPVRAYFLMFSDKVEADEFDTLHSMQRTVRSLCTYQGKKAGLEVFEDMITSQERVLEADGSILGLHKGDPVDVRMVQLGGRWYLCDTIQVHPQQAKPFMLKELKSRKKAGNDYMADFLFELAHMKWKRDHYKHLAVDQIYRSTSPA